MPTSSRTSRSIDGLIKMHRKGNRLLAELTSSHLNQDFIVLISIAKGIGRGQLLGGMSWGFGDDWIWQFRKVDDRIHVVRRNVRFTAAKGDPQEQAVNLAYTDSVLFSLPIVTTSPGGAIRRRTDAGLHERPAADLGRAARLHVFRKQVDLGRRQGLSQTTSSWKWRPPMPRAACWTSTRWPTAAARRSTSTTRSALLPQTGYQPRLADDRVGYFLTVRQGLLAQGRRRPLRALHQPLGSAEGRSLGRAFAAEEADHLLARKDDSLRLSQADPRRHRRMEQGLREGRLRQRHRSPPAAGQRRLGSGRHSTTTRSAGSRPAPASRWAPRA